jgi:hypothetical protein
MRIIIKHIKPTSSSRLPIAEPEVNDTVFEVGCTG